MKKKILHIRKFQDITYFLRRTFRTRTPNFETHPHRLRLRTTTFKINPYRLRLRTTIFKINPYRLRLRPQIWVRDIGFFLAAPPLFLRFFRDFATPGAAFFSRTDRYCMKLSIHGTNATRIILFGYCCF